MSNDISCVNRYLDKNLQPNDFFQTIYSSIFKITKYQPKTIKSLYDKAVEKSLNKELDYNEIHILFAYPLRMNIINKIDNLSRKDP